ncbi:hypothetical protein [Paenibacillus sp. 8b26]|uniref:hypothetical protein n=1 Tax=Paenibacillus sp. 8b26 TaxID=3424133 RepID=UPI003D658DA4
MTEDPSLFNELNVDRTLLHKALETGHGKSSVISEIINQALRSYVNRCVLDTHGYTETVFEFPKNQEVKKLFVKRLAH